MTVLAATTETPKNIFLVQKPVGQEVSAARSGPSVQEIADGLGGDKIFNTWMKESGIDYSKIMLQLEKTSMADKIKHWWRTAVDTLNTKLGAKNLGGKPEEVAPITLPEKMFEHKLPQRKWAVQEASTPRIEGVDGGPNLNLGREAVSYCGDSNANNVGNERFNTDQQQRINQEFGISNLLTNGNPDKETAIRHLASRWVQVEETLDKNGRGPLMGGLLQMELQLKDAIHDAIQNNNEMAIASLNRELDGLQIAKENPGNFPSPDGITPVDVWAQNRISTLQVVVDNLSPRQKRP